MTKQKGKAKYADNVLAARNGVMAQPTTMSIVMFLGHDVKEYKSRHNEIINQQIKEGKILCEQCLQSVAIHSNYKRGVKETGEQIDITMIWCSKCKIWHALLPDFLSPHKQYSCNEIESVIIDSGVVDNINEIDTKASESTVRRWINQISERIGRTISVLKYIFGRIGHTLNEVAIKVGFVYSELEQVLEMAPITIKYSGNKLGLANLWLGTNDIKPYI